MVMGLVMERDILLVGVMAAMDLRAHGSNWSPHLVMDAVETIDGLELATRCWRARFLFAFA